jgi:hypothetical protein
LTGVDVTLTPHLAQANGDIEMHTGVLDTAVVHTRDAEWLRRATAWQAAWLAGQPGHAERSTVTSVNQDGLSVTYADQASIVLAPRARRAIRNLSWMGSRSILPGNRAASAINRYNVVDPPDSEWSGIGDVP